MEGSGLGLDLKLMLAQTINFVLFTALFARFVAPSFFEFLKKQRKDEEERQAILVSLQKKKEENDEQIQELLKETRLEVKIIMQEADKEAKASREKILSEATVEAQEIRQKAKKQLEIERVTMMGNLREQIIRTSHQLVNTVLRDVISKTRQKEIIIEVVKKLPENIKV